MKILTIGGATQDIFIQYGGSDSIEMVTHGFTHCFLLLEEGQKIEVDALAYYVGGGAANAAVSFARLGFDASIFCKVGNDNAAHTIKQQLQHEKVNTSAICLSSCNQTATSFVIQSKGGERTIFAYRGATTRLQPEELPLELIAQSDLLYITSLSNQSSHALPTIVEHAHKAGVRIATNPGTSQLGEGAAELCASLEGIELLIMNFSEAKLFISSLIKLSAGYKKSMTDTQPLNQQPVDVATPYLVNQAVAHENLFFSIQNFFKEMLTMGPKVVIITNDKNGVYVAHGNHILYHPALPVELVNTVGAGDAFGSAFSASYFKGLPIEDALRNGIINSASVLSALGAQTGLLSFAELEKQRLQLPLNLVQRLQLV